MLKPREEVIQNTIIPSLTGRPSPSPTKRLLLGLPARLGGLGIRDPSEKGAEQLQASQEVTKPIIVRLLLEQHDGDSQACLQEALAEQHMAIVRTKRQKAEEEQDRHCAVLDQLPPPLRSAVERAKDDGALSWLSARPIQKHGFALHKGAFRDAIALRSGWEPLSPPLHCACAKSFNSCHAIALTCNKGGFTITRQNEIRDLTATLLKKSVKMLRPSQSCSPSVARSFCTQASTKTPKLGLTSKPADSGAEHSSAHSSNSMSGFSTHARARTLPPNRLHKCIAVLELSKRRYEKRVRDVEMSTFTPLVFSASGGFGPSALMTYRRIASPALPIKWSLPYSATMDGCDAV